MKKGIALGLVLICCLGLLIWRSSYAKKEKEKSISYYNSEISRLQSEIDNDERCISTYRIQYDNAMSKYQSAYKEEYLKEARQYDGNIIATEADIKVKQEEIDDLREKLNKLKWYYDQLNYSVPFTRCAIFILKIKNTYLKE